MRNAYCHWWTRSVVAARRVPEPYGDWVVGTGSLTARLRERCPGGFHVRVLTEGWRRPTLDEAHRLRVRRSRRAWIREVALCCHGTPQIVARSVIPAASLRGGNQTLRYLGHRPLGELLFRGAGSRREAMEVARLRDGDWLARRVTALGAGDATGSWARRVVHHLRGHPLLVAEVFLPELFESEDPWIRHSSATACASMRA